MSDVSDWWATAIIDMEPGRIAFRGRPIEDLIAGASFPQVIWLLTRGDMPSEAEAYLLERALVAAVDHGPQAPSIAAARMAATCGVPLQSAMASAVNMLGDVHGGAGEQALELFEAVRESGDARVVIDGWPERHVPGFGHRFHKPTDPRAPALMAEVRAARDAGTVSGAVMEAALAVEAELAEKKGRPIPMNIDGATAVIFGELGFPPPLARGLFVLSRSVGILAHAWEQTQQGGRNKGPTPPRYRWTYTGP